MKQVNRRMHGISTDLRAQVQESYEAMGVEPLHERALRAVYDLESAKGAVTGQLELAVVNAGEIMEPFAQLIADVKTWVTDYDQVKKNYNNAKRKVTRQSVKDCDDK
jgi:hypothetical protein